MLWMLRYLGLALMAWSVTGLSRGDVVDATAYDTVLRQYVDHGWVDYAGLASHRVALVGYLNRVEQADLGQASTAEQIAVWINAYNAAVLRLVLDHYPIERKTILGLIYPRNSIRQIPAAWERDQLVVDGGHLSLNEIVHEVLRKRFEEPRVLFALTGAAQGSPSLRAGAYLGEHLNSQLESATAGFLADPERGVRVDPMNRTVWISRIFLWYGQDFLSCDGEVRDDVWSRARGLSEAERAVLRFIRPYLSPEDGAFLDAGDFSLAYLPYDWRLNGQ
jgi:hypothetical protein